eukprot:2968920-Amphidinium_carterae.1
MSAPAMPELRNMYLERLASSQWPQTCDSGTAPASTSFGVRTQTKEPSLLHMKSVRSWRGHYLLAFMKIRWMFGLMA